ncbi:MAG: leucine-rich repeat protein [Tannerella sp.]|nr:leucine-rich repeat protein [Tannerella sp.]
MKRIFTKSVLALLGLMSLFSVAAQEVININRDASAVSLRSARAVANPEGAIETRAFDWNPRLQQLTAADKGKTLQLDLFDGRQYRAVIRNVATDYSGVLGITAVLTDFDFAACFIAISDAGITISADIPERDERYRAFVRDGETVLSCFSLIEEQKKEGQHIAVPAPTSRETLQLRNAPVETRADNIDEHVTLDILVTYTTTAKEWAAENATSIDNVINLAFQRANLVFDNSDTNVTLNLVHKYETDYQQTSSAGDDAEAIYFKSYDLRKQHHADLVVTLLVMNDGGFAGVPTDEASFRNYGDYLSRASAACRVQQVGESYTMAHEIGHTLGCGHNVETGGSEGMFNYSHGLRFVDKIGTPFHTVMAYQYLLNGTYSTPIPYFSNPDMTYNDVPIGDKATANSALTIKQTKHTVSRYSDYLNREPVYTVSAGVLTKYEGPPGYITIPSNLGITAIASNVFGSGPYHFYTVIKLPEGLKKIGEWAFNYSEITSIYIPASVDFIDYGAFSGCKNLKDVEVEWVNPLSIDKGVGGLLEVFGEVDLSQVTLHVPKGTKSKYQTAPVWKNFGTIVEISPAAIETVAASTQEIWSSGGSIHITVAAATTLSVYTVSGSLVRQQALGAGETSISLPQGVYIVKVGDTAQKVIVR